MLTFYLHPEYEPIEAKLEIDPKAYGEAVQNPYFSGKVWKAIESLAEIDDPVDAVSGWEFHSDVRIKRDGCSHWNFFGKYYDPDKPDDTKDSYYHLCGCYSMLDHLRLMIFAWKCAELFYEKLKNEDLTRREWYDEPEFDNKELSALERVLLNGYTITICDEKDSKEPPKTDIQQVIDHINDEKG